MTPDTQKALDALNTLQYSAYGIDIRDADEVDQCVATIRAALQNAGGWRPIESAPKDGTAILVYGTSPHTGDSWHEVAHYNDIQKMFMSGSRLVGHDFLTHWQPLPPTPSELAINIIPQKSRI